MEEDLREESFVHLKGPDKQPSKSRLGPSPGKTHRRDRRLGFRKVFLGLGDPPRRVRGAISSPSRPLPGSTSRGSPPSLRQTRLSAPLSPSRRSTARNPRSTVATLTEIYDFLRVLFARIGFPVAPSAAGIFVAILRRLAERLRRRVASRPRFQTGKRREDARSRVPLRLEGERAGHPL